MLCLVHHNFILHTYSFCISHTTQITKTLLHAALCWSKMFLFETKQTSLFIYFLHDQNLIDVNNQFYQHLG